MGLASGCEPRPANIDRVRSPTCWQTGSTVARPKGPGMWQRSPEAMTRSESMSSEQPFDNEQKGAKAGLNPMFGDWQHRFRFAPVPYGDGAAKRTAFRKAIQAELTNNFFYTAEVRLEITL